MGGLGFRGVGFDGLELRVWGFGVSTHTLALSRPGGFGSLGLRVWECFEPSREKRDKQSTETKQHGGRSPRCSLSLRAKSCCEHWCMRSVAMFEDPETPGFLLFGSWAMKLGMSLHPRQPS